MSGRLRLSLCELFGSLGQYDGRHATGRLLFYFWEPDLTFRQAHRLISFPENNEQQWALGNKATWASTESGKPS